MLYKRPTSLDSTLRFPLWKFSELAQTLLSDGLLEPKDFLPPRALPEDSILLAHEADYYRRFRDDTLDATRWRRIGFAQRPDHGQLVTGIGRP